MDQVKVRGLRFLRASALPVAAVLGLTALLPCTSASGPGEYEVKAAFLLNFTKFVGWPDSAFEAPDSPMNICVLGDDPFGAALDQIVAGEIVDGRRVGVVRMKGSPAAKACQVIFVNPAKSSKTEPVAGPVLTVGEGEVFLRAGGMIGFVIENRRVRFEINQQAAENAGLKISSKLLSVAKKAGE